MKYRKLRIAWSVAWDVVAVLLCVLWVRSYWWNDEVGGPVSARRVIGVTSGKGRTSLFLWTYPEPPGIEWNVVRLEYDGLRDFVPFTGGPPFGADVSSSAAMIYFPTWCSAAVAAALGMAAWVRCLRRFSLRTLLIATTLIAVLLGLIVWASRAG